MEGSVEKAEEELEDEAKLLNEPLRSREERGPVSTALKASAHCSPPVTCPDMVDSVESTRWREAKALFDEGAGEESAEVEALRGELLKSGAVGGGRGNARRWVLIVFCWVVGQRATVARMEGRGWGKARGVARAPAEDRVEASGGSLVDVWCRSELECESEQVFGRKRTAGGSRKRPAPHASPSLEVPLTVDAPTAAPFRFPFRTHLSFSSWS